MPQADHGRLFLRTQSCLASYFICFHLAFYFLWDYGILSLFWFWVVFPDSAVCILDLYLEAQSAKTKATNQQFTIKPKHTTKRSSEMLGSGISRILSFWFLKHILLNASEPISFICTFCHKYSDYNALVPAGTWGMHPYDGRVVSNFILQALNGEDRSHFIGPRKIYAID